MRSGTSKLTILIVAALLTVGAVAAAQDVDKAPRPAKSSHSKARLKASARHSKTGDGDTDFQFNLDGLIPNINIDLNDNGNILSINSNKVSAKLSVNVHNISKMVNVEVDNVLDNLAGELKDLNIEVSDGDMDNDQTTSEGQSSDKYKTYSKAYPLDANDRIRLSNQYGKITVITWDKREVKVDVRIRAQANDDGEAQKLLDEVQIQDSKNGDEVSFRTSVKRTNGSYNIFSWGGRKVHKLDIDYTVYMPARTDLNVEDNYGAIVLPTLEGRVKISSSYGSVTAQNLTNASSEIDGSYGNLKMGIFNGSKLDFSYGNVDMAECNNLKADLSYGSFKLGKLKGSADIDMSYVGGFRIAELATSAKRLNINASYSGVAVGMPGNSNFDFDITVSNAGFSFNDDKVTITSKTPADNKHYSPTKNYKGHFGKGSSEARVTVNSSYGSVHFE